MGSTFDFGSLFPSFQQTELGNNLGYNSPGSYMEDYGNIMKMFQPGPATTNYMSYVQQVPKREDYEPGLLQKILAGVAGGSLGALGNPLAGAKEGADILDSKYNQALEDYKTKAGALAQGANIEQSQQKQASSLLPDIMKMREAGREFGITSGQNQQKITNERDAQQQQFQINQRKNELEAEQQKIDAAYKQGLIGVEQRNAATQENRAKVDALESSSRVFENTMRGVNYGATGAKSAEGRTSAALQKQQLANKLAADPVLSKYLGRDNNGNLNGLIQGKIKNDPEAFARYQQLLREFSQ